jgi:hypothetical protein
MIEAKSWPSMSAWLSGSRSGSSLPIRQPVAAWHQREHQWPAAPVLAKGTDLSRYTQRELNAIAHRLNTRPRKCLNFATSLEVFTHLRHYSPVALGT